MVPHQKTNTKTLDKNGSFPSRKFHELWPVLIISHTPKYKKNGGCRNPILSLLYPNYIPLYPRISPHSTPIKLLVISIPFIVSLWMGYVFSITIPCRHVFLHIIYNISPITTPYISLENHHLDDPNELTSKYEDVPMIFPWFSHGVNMILTWSSNDVLMIFSLIIPRKRNLHSVGEVPFQTPQSRLGAKLCRLGRLFGAQMGGERLEHPPNIGMDGTLISAYMGNKWMTEGWSMDSLWLLTDNKISVNIMDWWWIISAYVDDTWQ